MSEPKDGASTRRSRLQGIVEFIMDRAGDGCSTLHVTSYALVAFGLKRETVERELRELREAGVLRFDRDGWHTTAKAREFFK